VYRTLIGLLLAALTGVWLYMLGRRRYKCPYCGRSVKWSDERCPHCGDDMKFRHRVGPEPRITKPPLIARTTAGTPPRRRTSSRPGSGS
jgi:predicted amidophosphoribosyltransferase